MCIDAVRDARLKSRAGGVGPGLTGVMATGQSYMPSRPSNRLMRAGAIMPVMPLFGVQT
jgi:hypothetical protein